MLNKRIFMLPILVLLSVLFCSCQKSGTIATNETASAVAIATATPSNAAATPLPTPDFQGPVSRVEGKSFLVRATDGEMKPFFVKGVDIGAAKPGYWPGEFGIESSDYLRWFQQIGELNANTIRVYVPQMPVFYDALLTYNLQAEHPLYLMQGIYMNEELISTHLDAFQSDLIDTFHRDLGNTIDIIHGNATVEKLPGNAGGVYTADVSAYVIGYLPESSSLQISFSEPMRSIPTKRNSPAHMLRPKTLPRLKYSLPRRRSS